MPESSNPYEPPHADLETGPPHGDGWPRLASRAVRFWAAAIDWVLLTTSQLLASWLGVADLVPADLPERRRVALAFASGFVPFFAAHVVCVHCWHASPGKALLGARMVLASGGEASAARLLLLRPLLFLCAEGTVMIATGMVDGRDLRTLLVGLTAIVLLADVLRILGPDRRCLHDVIAGTSVVQTGRAQSWPTWPEKPAPARLG